jgi:hypothetical protein
MSSGSFAGPAGFRTDKKPGGVPACPGWDREPRGPGLLLAGACVACGRSTICRDDAGMPRHRPGPQLAACQSCGEPMRRYYAGQRAHPSCEAP